MPLTIFTQCQWRLRGGETGAAEPPGRTASERGNAASPGPSCRSRADSATGPCATQLVLAFRRNHGSLPRRPPRARRYGPASARRRSAARQRSRLLESRRKSPTLPADLAQQLLSLEKVDAAGEQVEQGPHGALFLHLLVDEPLQELEPAMVPRGDRGRRP